MEEAAGTTVLVLDLFFLTTDAEATVGCFRLDDVAGCGCILLDNDAVPLVLLLVVDPTIFCFLELCVVDNFLESVAGGTAGNDDEVAKLPFQ